MTDLTSEELAELLDFALFRCAHQPEGDVVAVCDTCANAVTLFALEIVHPRPIDLMH